MALTDKLTAIADAVRDKTGTTDAMTLTQIAETIAAIETGGDAGAGLSEFGVSKMSSGTITPDGGSGLEITHGLGVIPKVIFICGDSPAAALNYNNMSNFSIFSVILSDADGTEWTIRQITGKGNASWSSLGSCLSGIVQGNHTASMSSYFTAGIQNATDSMVSFYACNGAGNTSYFLSGVTYKWFCLA